MEQGPTCPTCHVQCRGETLLLGVPRLVIKYSASLSNTKSLYTLCAPPLVTAGEASACWGRKSELAGRAGKKKRQERVGQRTQKKQSNESKRKLMQLLVPAPRVSPHHQGPTGVQSSSFPQPCCQTGGAASQPLCPRQAPRLALSLCPPPALGCITLESPPGRIQAGQSSGAALLIRAHQFLGHLFSSSYSLMISTRQKELEHAAFWSI